jgi:indolepyruvate ferredoxin oxidoreductase beta subunit
MRGLLRRELLRAKMRVQMIISGVGGQGVLLLTRIFAAFALEIGLPIIGAEDHGMSQRGGSVMTHLKIGEFSSPLIKKGDADILFALEKNEAYKTLHYLRPSIDERKGGLCFINASDPDYMNPQIKAYLEEKGIGTYMFAADQFVKEMGVVQSANIALVSFAAAHPRFPFAQDRLRVSIEKATPLRFREISLKVFDRGFLEGKKSIKA